MQIGGGEKLKPGAKKSFCTYHMHETRGVNYVGQNPHEEVKGTDETEGISE